MNDIGLHLVLCKWCHLLEQQKKLIVALSSIDRSIGALRLQFVKLYGASGCWKTSTSTWTGRWKYIARTSTSNCYETQCFMPKQRILRCIVSASESRPQWEISISNIFKLIIGHQISLPKHLGADNLRQFLIALGLCLFDPSSLKGKWR